MLIVVLAFFGGVLTILSPCILPVVPFVFARADRPFRSSTLPLLGGMGLTFAAVAAAAAAGGQWIVRANQYGRGLALVVLAVLGLSLLWPGLAERWTRPLVKLGGRLQRQGSGTGRGGEPGVAGSLLLGASIGLLWAPCAGPILGLLLAAAALNGVSARTLVLLLAFAAGAAAALGVAVFAGSRVLGAMKRGLGAEAWIRRGLGVLVLLAVVAIALGADTRWLAGLSYFSTNGLEQKLVTRFAPARGSRAGDVSTLMPVRDVALKNMGPLPDFDGATAWLNSPPLAVAQLRGHVVLVDFWTYSCINCLRTLPYLEAWQAKYGPQGLVIVGVHTPEFAFERDLANVRAALPRLGVTYPVAVDNDHAIWDAYGNEYWPAHYFADAEGRLRYYHFGEGGYVESERVIQELLAEAHHTAAPPGTFVEVAARGAEAAAGDAAIASPETYIGYGRQAGFASPQAVAQNNPTDYTLPARLEAGQWGLEGRWQLSFESGTLLAPGGAIAYRFSGRDLHLVLGAKGAPVRFRVTLDGGAPGDDHGADTDAEGNGTIRAQRLYQLLRLRQPGAYHLFRIEFLDAGAQAYSFTFG